jgi:hypothetical protein
VTGDTIMLLLKPTFAMPPMRHEERNVLRYQTIRPELHGTSDLIVDDWYLSKFIISVPSKVIAVVGHRSL